MTPSHIYSWIWARVVQDLSRQPQLLWVHVYHSYILSIRRRSSAYESVFFLPALLWFSLSLGGGNKDVSFNAKNSKIICSRSLTYYESLIQQLLQRASLIKDMYTLYGGKHQYLSNSLTTCLFRKRKLADWAQYLWPLSWAFDWVHSTIHNLLALDSKRNQLVTPIAVIPLLPLPDPYRIWD